MTITPIRKVDSTGAVRAKRYRERKRQHAVTARHATVTLAVMLAALASASVSAGFAITGLTTIFRGAFWPVVGMGIALEAGKLSAVAWLGRGVTAQMLEIAEAKPAVFLGRGDPVQSESAHLRPEIAREEIVAVDCGGARRDLFFRERPRALADHPGALAEVEIERTGGVGDHRAGPEGESFVRQLGRNQRCCPESRTVRAARPGGAPNPFPN